MPSDKDKVKLHDDLKEILSVFDKICDSNYIKYSLHGGSLLGAVREKGFIPWDDDIDVTMTRDNYEKFKHYMNNKNKNKDIMLDELFGHGPMLWLKGHNGNSVWIDIFIYDYISENWLAQKIKFIMLVFFLGWLKTNKRMQVAKMGKFKGWRYHIIYLLYLLGKPVSRSRKNKLRSYCAEHFLCGSKKLMVRSNDQYIGLKLFISKEAIVHYKRIPFEDISVMIHAGYDEILKSSYGNDYMKPIKTDTVHQNAHNMVRNTW